jgi:hypothetical protein
LLSAVVAAAVVILALGFVLSPQPTAGRAVAPPTVAQRTAVPNPKVRFTDVTEQAGIRFTHNNGYSGKKLLPETMGAGVAVIDFDNDGLPDLLFINGRPWPGREKAGEPLPTMKLYHNLGNGKFADVTEAVGLNIPMYGMGATVGDYDNDGFADLFVTGVGGNRLFHNEPAPAGKGVKGRWFKDVTAEAGVAAPAALALPDAADGDFLQRDRPVSFSTSAAFVDYDGDGLLDLFVCNYVTWSPQIDFTLSFTRDGSERAFGPPTTFEGSQCFLYRNVGNGKFVDVSTEAGIQVFEKEGTDDRSRRRNVGKSLGVIVCDLDEDGWPDIVVANDTVRNFCFHNVPGPNGARVFEEIGLKCGIAYADGNARGAMGIDWGIGIRPGKDGKLGSNALLIGNFANEPDTFLCPIAPKKLRLIDTALREGVDGPSRKLLKFGAFFFDYDLDGRLDILTCNGHLEPEIAKTQGGQTYAQPPQLFWNAGEDGFQEVSVADAGPDLFRPMIGRGCAYLSMEGKGPPDLVLTANRGKARLLRNEGGAGNHWIRLRLEGDGVRSNRSAIGASVTLEAAGVTQRREVCSARGYLSQSETVLTFGLGKATGVDRVTIGWPGKQTPEPEVITDLEIDREHHIKQQPAR